MAMRKAAGKRILAPVDVPQRYTVAEAVSYLRISHASIYKEIKARRIGVLKHGKRTFVPGSEIARVSRLEGHMRRHWIQSPTRPRSRSQVKPRAIGYWIVAFIRY